MIPNRPQSAAPQSKRESIPTRLARLRSEQTPRTRFNSPTSAPSSGSVAAWLRPVGTVQGRNGSGSIATRGRRGLAGPPPPPSWREPQIISQASTNTARTIPRLKPRQLVERRRLVELLEPGGAKQAHPETSVDPLFDIAGGTIARDLARGQEESVLLEHVAYLPTHLKMRLLDVLADWKNPWSLTNSGAKELLRTDLDEMSEGDDWEDSADLEESEHDDEWDRLPSKRELAIGSLSLTDEFSTPLSTSLTHLNLSFSSITLKTLRSILLLPSTSTAPSLSSASPHPKLIPTFPHLHTLTLASTRNIPILHDHFFSLLSLLLSIRTLSLAGNSIVALDTESSSCCAPRLFALRLANATPLLRSLDLGYLETIDPESGGGAGGGRGDEFELERDLVKKVDWENRWLGLKLIGLRGMMRCATEGEVDGLGSEDAKADFKKEIRGWIGTKRKTGKWIDVVL
ncbi:hypothetical protein JCM16303_002099 [Sporobolomyces ruberrimus]